jgi:hypothetical protein
VTADPRLGFDLVTHRKKCSCAHCHILENSTLDHGVHRHATSLLIYALQVSQSLIGIEADSMDSLLFITPHLHWRAPRATMA